MSRIRQLDEILANKIAAGEVIERPANVVKELVENSIDASSSHIEIYIEEGGIESIEVKDDGIGMDYEDALMCFSRHATSKIINSDDLFNISTLGFRGEAIPSIASVSKFTLMSSDGNKGTEVVYEYGKFIEDRKIDKDRGTDIKVEKLFWNVPARLKYLKSINTEFSAIYQYVERLALGYPEISFSLYHNNKRIFYTNGNGQLLEVISCIYGINTAKNMVKVDIENDEFKITGYTSKIDTNRASKSNIITLVNHRYVRNKKSIDAIDQVYRKYLFDHRYPIAIINIDVDPYLVDVNVHPSKLEVRFSKEMELSDLIKEGIERALNSVNLTYQEKNRETEKEVFKPDLSQLSMDLEEVDVVKENPIIYEEPLLNKDLFIEKDVQPIKETINPLKEKIYAKAQIHGTYIVGENEKGMYLCDQHAAQERINYEYYKEKYSHLDLTMQPMLFPLHFDYSLSDYMVISEHKDLLEQVGIHLEPFSDQCFIVRELPLWMKNIDQKVFIEEMIEQILTKKKIDVMSLTDHAIATLSCKASVKGNTYLTLDEMQTLLDNLMRCTNPYVCPHGRPTLIFYSTYELEKLFKRVI